MQNADHDRSGDAGDESYNQPRPRIEEPKPFVVYKPRPTPTPSAPASGGNKVAIGVGALAVAACLGFGGFVALSGSSETTATETAAAPDRGVEPRAEDPPPLARVASPTDGTPPATQQAANAEGNAELHAQALTTVPADLLARVEAENPKRWAVYTRDGQIRLQGRVSSQEQAELYIANTAKVIGEANVINDYLIDPTLGEVVDGPVYVEEAILYKPGSAEITDDFRPLLDLGAILFAVNPNVEVTLIGHTDSDGSAEENLALSAARIESAFQYYRDRDVDTTRLFADPRGETEPIADNSTEEGRRLNRRLEIIIEGFADE